MTAQSGDGHDLGHDIGLVSSHAGAHFESVQDGKRDVQQDDRGVERLEFLDCLGTVESFFETAFETTHDGREDLHVQRVVLKQASSSTTVRLKGPAV